MPDSDKFFFAVVFILSTVFGFVVGWIYHSVLNKE